MGGCASKPKESEFQSQYCPPSEVPPPALTKAELEAELTAQVTENGDEKEKEKQVEEPLADLSEPKEEASILSPSAVPASAETTELVEPNAETVVAETKEEETKEPAKVAVDDKSNKDEKDIAPLVQP
ncbi:hypothetical protein SLEP1_g34903 [Rubroshorea leprosula]|uniref:Uncharacterized protein n=1 Tax=Rubroshorea leprosula TaxID=152421 RepID=A0AAV5KLH5_9ROSI|nr:hypothetical protein SLEP1_g34903 [Rubroshorea leprosula]